MSRIVAAALARPSLVVGAKEIAEAWGRAPRGVDHVRVPAWDEDASTLAVDAASGALRLARESGAALRSVVVLGASGSLVMEAVGSARARLVEATGSGVDALALGFALEAPCLVVAAHEPSHAPGTDARIEEGAGAVAFLLVEGEGEGVELAAESRVSILVPGARRASDGYERGPLSEVAPDEALAAAASRLDAPRSAPLFVAGAAPRGAKPQRPAFDLRKDWGALGSVEPLAQLIESWRQGFPREAWCLVASASQDHAACLALSSAGAPAVRAPHERATRVGATRALAESRALARFSDVPDSPMGAYVPMGTWVEDLPARLRLVAQRCESCGRAQYPPRGACAACRGRAFTDVPLPPTALVYAATRIGRGGAPSEYALEQSQVGAYWVGVVEWPEMGVRVTARLAGFDEHGPAIGDQVHAVVRRLFEQEGAVRYGVKFASSS